MRIYKSAYFDSFRCIAGRCPDSCCKEWDVQVDSNTAEFYRGLPGPLGDRLRQGLFDDPDAGTVMTIENGRCPMWRPDGLCRIQAELGHDALCKTCREFPRLTHDYGDFIEYGLELSCPEAARLILTSPSEPFAVTEVPGGDAPEYDADAMAVLSQTREAAFALLADPAYTVPEALTLLLFYGYQSQALLDGEDAPEFDAKQSLSQAAEMAAPGGIAPLLQVFLRAGNIDTCMAPAPASTISCPMDRYLPKSGTLRRGAVLAAGGFGLRFGQPRKNGRYLLPRSQNSGRQRNRNRSAVLKRNRKRRG